MPDLVLSFPVIIAHGFEVDLAVLPNGIMGHLAARFGLPNAAGVDEALTSDDLVHLKMRVAEQNEIRMDLAKQFRPTMWRRLMSPATR